ncbi:recombination protein RecR [candidate division KSB1 bacterium]|nr:recombination protein RecR [candidate division KSB1 bacterium]
MERYFSDSIQHAVDELSKLPGIGKKSAQRIVFFLLKIPKPNVVELADSLVDIKDKSKFCSVCYNITDTDPCPICSSGRRDQSTICVVEEANDVIALEKTGEYRGLFHVLGGALSPLDGIGPDELRVKELMTRLKEDVQEVIIATNPNTEGEATAIYLAKLIQPLNIKITRIARGIPVGIDIEHADEITLSRAIEGRVTF